MVFWTPENFIQTSSVARVNRRRSSKRRARRRQLGSDLHYTLCWEKPGLLGLNRSETRTRLGVGFAGDGIDQALITLAVADRHGETGREEMPDGNGGLERSDDVPLQEQLPTVAEPKRHQKLLPFLGHPARADEKAAPRHVLRHTGHRRVR